MPDEYMLTPEEAIHIILEGTHAEFELDSAVANDYLISALRAGAIEAALLPDGKIAFRKVED